MLALDARNATHCQKIPGHFAILQSLFVVMFTSNELILQYILNALLVNPTENVNGSASIFFHSAPNPASSLPRPHT